MEVPTELPIPAVCNNPDLDSIAENTYIEQARSQILENGRRSLVL